MYEPYPQAAKQRRWASICHTQAILPGRSASRCLTAILMMLWLWLLPSHASAAALRLTYDMHTEVERQKDEGSQEQAEVTTEKSDEKLVITLMPQQVWMDMDGGRTIVDLAAKRLRNLSREDNTYQDLPLDAMVAYRVAELQNRIFIQGALSAAGIQEKGASLFDLETEFGILWDHDSRGLERGEVKVEKTESGIRLLHEGVEASSCEFSSLTSKLMQPWLVYGCRLHPRMLETLLESGRVPERLVYRSNGMFEKRVVSLTLTGSEEIQDPGEALPEGAKKHVDETNELSKLQHQIQTGENLPPRITPEQTDAFVTSAINESRWLDAALALLEISLQDGVKDQSQRMREVLDKAGDDPALKAWTQAVSMQGPEQAGPALKLLDSIDTQGLEKAYMLDIIRANLNTAAGRHEKVVPLFMSVLQQNPYITGVWFDLGQYYYQQFEIPTAWNCIDTARTIQPDHPMLANFDAFVQRLRVDFPHFYGGVAE